MRAGRLLSLLLVLQDGRRLTAGELARRLEVSERTVLRDLEVLSGAGVPVVGTRGPGGGFELLDTFHGDVPSLPAGLSPGRGRLRRVRVRISPAALQRVLIVGRPEGWRPRPHGRPDGGAAEGGDWLVGSFRFDSYESAVAELLGLGVEVEVVLPVELRAVMADVGRMITARHESVHEVGDEGRNGKLGQDDEAASRP